MTRDQTALGVTPPSTSIKLFVPFLIFLFISMMHICFNVFDSICYGR